MFQAFEPSSMGSAAFLRDEAQFHVVNRVAEGELAVALQAADGSVIALQNPGRAMWLWVDPALGREAACERLAGLAEALQGADLPGVTAAPEVAPAFAEEYCRRRPAQWKLGTRLIAYQCPEVRPVNAPGHVLPAGPEDLETVARFHGGFLRDCFGQTETEETMHAAAVDILQKGRLRLWHDGGEPVSMAAITQKTARHARIGMVYTSPERRGRGYAGALVAELSRQMRGEGLLPMLYADAANPISNGVYRRIGYIEVGRVQEISFAWNA